MIPSNFACKCPSKKERRITFDGGILDCYCVDVCASCYNSISKKFLVKEDMLI